MLLIPSSPPTTHHDLNDRPLRLSLHLQGQYVSIKINMGDKGNENSNSNSSSIMKMILSHSLLSQSTVNVGGGCGVDHIGHDTRFHS